MSQDAFTRITNDNCRLIFPTYHSFLGSLGLLLSESIIEYSRDEKEKEPEEHVGHGEVDHGTKQ